MTMLLTCRRRTNHPAKYTTILLPVVASMLRRRRVLDPFGGVGRPCAQRAVGDGAHVMRGSSRNGALCTATYDVA